MRIMRDATGSHILILQPNHCSWRVTALCFVVSYLIKLQIFSDRVVGRRPFTEQLRILAIVTTVQHFNRYSAIKLYPHMHPL